MHPTKPQTSHNEDVGVFSFENASNSINFATEEFGLTSKLGLTVMIQKKSPKYKPARLCNSKGDLSKRWYIEFYAWSEEKNKLIRKRHDVPSKYTTEKQRNEYAKSQIDIINGFLGRGVILSENGKLEIPHHIGHGLKIKSQITQWLASHKNRIRRESYHSFKTTVNSFIAWLEENNLESLEVSQFGKKHAIEYREFLLMQGNKGGRTINDGYMSHLNNFFNYLCEKEIISKNPISGIKKLNIEDRHKNLAFTDEQREQLSNYIKTNDPKLFIFINFMYYCFIRPKEIRQLRIENIDIQKYEISIPGKISKNRKHGTVVIPEEFRPTLIEFFDFENDTGLLFKGNGEGGMIGKNIMNRRHNLILKKLGYSNEHTLYSWKHTGVTAAYRAGVDIKSIQMQCRHHNISETDTYLRSLGLFGNKRFESKMPKI